jgi:hypothetical protein
MVGLEGMHDLGEEGPSGREGEQADAQLTSDAGRQLADRGERPVDLVVAGAEAVAQLFTQRGQPHLAAGALEQPATGPRLHRTDHLTDPGLGHVHPLRGTTEVQLLGQHEEDLDLPQFHDPPSPSTPSRRSSLAAVAWVGPVNGGPPARRKACDALHSSGCHDCRAVGVSWP